eukprot:m.39135 g.39135  ORF g.39135 m.39135 type:complete len:308 (+) comp5759_c0_seq1:169-1092(+)
MGHGSNSLCPSWCLSFRSRHVFEGTVILFVDQSSQGAVQVDAKVALRALFPSIVMKEMVSRVWSKVQIPSGMRYEKIPRPSANAHGPGRPRLSPQRPRHKNGTMLDRKVKRRHVVPRNRLARPRCMMQRVKALDGWPLVHQPMARPKHEIRGREKFQRLGHRRRPTQPKPDRRHRPRIALGGHPCLHDPPWNQRTQRHKQQRNADDGTRLIGEADREHVTPERRFRLRARGLQLAGDPPRERSAVGKTPVQPGTQRDRGPQCDLPGDNRQRNGAQGTERRRSFPQQLQEHGEDGMHGKASGRAPTKD